MQITVTLDDALYEQALKMAEPGISDSELVNEALRAFIQIRTAHRVAIGGTNGLIRSRKYSTPIALSVQTRVRRAIFKRFPFPHLL